MEPDPGPGYLGSSAAAKLGGRNGSRYSLRDGKNGVQNGKNGVHNGKNGATGAATAAAAAAAALPDIGAVLKSISQVLYDQGRSPLCGSLMSSAYAN